LLSDSCKQKKNYFVSSRHQLSTNHVTIETQTKLKIKLLHIHPKGEPLVFDNNILHIFEKLVWFNF